MTQMNFNIDDQLDEEFRKIVFKTKGMKKGVLLEALEEAVKLWIKEKEKNYNTISTRQKNKGP